MSLIGGQRGLKLQKSDTSKEREEAGTGCTDVTPNDCTVTEKCKVVLSASQLLSDQVQSAFICKQAKGVN